MRTQNQDIDKQPVVYAKRSHAHPGIGFVSTLALLLSLLSLGISGFLAYRFLDLQQAFGVIDSALNRGPAPQRPDAAPNQSTPQSANQPAQPAASTAIQPGQFVQAVQGGSAQVELIAVNRIQNPTTQARDAVNVQFRVRRTAAPNQGNSAPLTINPGETTARNSASNETYPALDPSKLATDAIAVNTLTANATVDAYVWLRVPEGVSTIDIQIPNTQGFRNVPIAN